MSEFVAPDGSRHAIFGEGGGRRLAKLTGAPLVGVDPDRGRGVGRRRPRPAGRARRARQRGRGAAFAAIADRIVTELLPPVEMAGCTARIFELAEQLA